MTRSTEDDRLRDYARAAATHDTLLFLVLRLECAEGEYETLAARYRREFVVGTDRRRAGAG